MKETRIKISSIINNQLPQFVEEEFPLVSEFLSQYYISLENQGGTNDILQNIDQYVKVDNLTNLVDSTILTEDVTFFDSTIKVKSTAGFPNSYGLLLIDSEIITYTSKTETSFEGCIRGFSGVTSYKEKKDELTFTESESQEHSALVNDTSTQVTNLSVLFLKEFLVKVKKQITPGFENRELYSGLDEGLFIKQSIDFYSSKGTDASFKILFGALYGQDVEVIRPRDYLIQPSDAQYRVTSDLVVEAIQGNPENLVNSTLYQKDSVDDTIAQGTITQVERIRRGSKDYYVISLDFDYDKDIQSVGTVYGKFEINPRTRCVSEIISGSTTLDVDSTVAFPNSNGNLVINLENGTSLNITYGSKTLNQFLDCTGITQNIPPSTEVNADSFAYGYLRNELIKVRVLGVLSELNLPSNTTFYSADDVIRIKSLGIDKKEYKFNNWFFNVASKYEVNSIELLDDSDKSYKINLYDDHYFKVGDSVTITSSFAVDVTGSVISFNNEKSFSVQLGSEFSLLNLNASYVVKRNLSKVNTENYPSVNKYTSNVQNVYLDKDESFYVASPSLPSYLNRSLKVDDRSVTFTGSFFPNNSSEGTTLDLSFPNGPHGLYTGDSIVYKPSSGNSLGISTGIYFVKKVNDNEIKLAKSKNNIFTENFVLATGNVTDAKFELKNFTYDNLSSQLLESQKLIRKISTPKNDGKIYETNPGSTGIFINGVEVLNYKSRDNVHYGPIENISVTSSGNNYDIKNPPILKITDPVGSGASGYCSVIGQLERIDILDPGFDYIDEPIIDITGGNGSGAIAKANLISFEHNVSFNSQGYANLVKLNPDNKIGFSSYHKFRNAEEVIYVTDGQSSVGGLSTNSAYFVSIQDEYNVKIHKTYDDAVSGINTIQLTSYGVGNHSLKSKNLKKIIGSITVTNSGENYENKLTTTITGINTATNNISILNHGYKTGEIIVYNATETAVGGLSSSSSYYVTKISDDEFKLSQVGVGSTGSFYYDTKQYIDLTSVGSGTHKFNYPEIKVSVRGKIGVSTFSGQNFDAVLQPILRGKIQSVFVYSNGSRYGSEDIINYNRQPTFNLNSGSGSELIAIVSNGKIEKVLINRKGKGYNSPPDLKINGSGSGAVLVPIIKNGSIIDVKVINQGKGYSNKNTTISIIPSGFGAKFEAQIKSWKINLVERLIQSSKINDDDGILTEGLNKNYGLQYAHAYAPRYLRMSVQSSKLRDGNKIYITDLQILDNKESSDANSIGHSPIIGWAYDGNPIYGPYGYSSKTGGSIKGLVSGYRKKDNISSDLFRPSTLLYPEGFFVEDYIYDGSGDLDEHNGRFGVTPEYPNGVYAYFTTIDNGKVEETGIFANYKKPTFPYVIGSSYKSKPIEFNFDSSSNQDFIDINQTHWKRNIRPYNSPLYDYLLNPNSIKNQNSVVRNVLAGSVDSVGILTGGKNYKVEDRILFDTELKSQEAQAKVSLIKGKNVNQISVATSQFNNVEFYPYNQQFIGFATVPHNYLNNDLITFTGKNDYQKSGNIKVTENKLILSSGIGSVQNTGLVTYFNVLGNLKYPEIKENDIYQIGDEQIKVLNVDLSSSRIRVVRNQNGTVGISSYSVGIALTEKTKKLQLSFGISTSYNFNIDREFYFDPKESVGIGTTSGVGIVSTIYFSNPGVGITQIAIPTQSIYIESHNLNTGDSLIYSSNGGTQISVSTDGSSVFQLGDKSIVYVAKISNDLIGISTFKVGLGSTGSFVSVGSSTSQGGILYFTSVGTGNTHSFKTNVTNKLIGQISRNLVTVSTAETHGLSLFDSVIINVKSGISTTFVVKYNDYNRRMILNPRSFSTIDTENNTIEIIDHGYYTGQKVIYSSETPSSGLVNENVYYVVVIDSNNIRLSNSFYQATKINPETVDINSSSSGNILPINPPITLTRNQNVIFDLSDSSLSFTNNSVSYPAFDLKLYKDDKLREEFDTTATKSTFEVSRVGRVGIDSTAKITLTLNDNVPRELYYSLVPENLSLNSQIKKDIIRDGDVIGSNKITLNESEYNGTYSIAGISTNSFTFNLLNKPELTSYSNNIEYYTNSSTAEGEISQISMIKGGKYKSLPGITSIASRTGSNAILSVNTKSIGKISNSKIQDIGFDYSSDFSVRPTAKLPSILVLDPLSSFDYIGITSLGRNYSIAPSLVVIDGLTDKVVEDIELTYKLGDPKVTIKKNNTSISNIKPKIIPVNNSNGIKIQNIVFNNSTKNVTVTLGASFSSPEEFPFAIGDKVLIEGTSVGIGTTGKGYNSSNYNYSLFTLTQIDPNIGGTVGIVTYNLSSYLQDGEIPGKFDSEISAGKIIPESDFPIFNPVLKKNKFYQGEFVHSNTAKGKVESQNLSNDYIKVSGIDDFVSGELVRGETSDSVAIIKEVFSFETDYKVDSTSTVEKGWNKETGFLNSDSQRIHDSDYYQYFSYALKSNKELNLWDNPVSSLNHTAGFKKFSNLTLESLPLNSGISTDQNFGDFTSIVDFYNISDINCVYDFDLATENNLIIDQEIKSTEILLESRDITSYIESVGNRVLMIDDVSKQFNSNPRPTQFEVVESFDLSKFRSKKYFALAQDKKLTNEKQFTAISLLHDNSVGFINQYSVNTLNSNNNLGFFDFSISEDSGNLLFYPVKSKFNNYHLELFSFSLNDSISGVGTVNLGNSVKVDTSTTIIPQGTGISTTIVGIASTYRSSKVLVQIGATDSSYYEFNELTILNDENNIHILDYGQVSTDSPLPKSTSGIGSYNAYLSGSQIKIDLIPYSSTAVDYIVNTFNVSLAKTTATATGSQVISGSSINSSSTTISSSGSPVPNTILSFSNNDYVSSYCIISIEDKTNSEYQVSEFLVATNSSENSCYITEFGILNTNSPLGVTTAGISGSNTNIYFTPNENIDVDVKVFGVNVGLKENNDLISLINGNVGYSYGSYTGTNNDIKKTFNLNYKNLPIFQRYFNGSDSKVVDIIENTITIPNNFYVTGEEVTYSYPGLGTTQAIGIATTSIAGLGSTDKLPTTVYIVKIDDKNVRVAASSSDALKSIPNVLDLTSVGVGNSHAFTSKNANNKVIIGIDNVIQSPIVSTSVTTNTVQNITFFDSQVYVSGIGSIYGGDLIKIDDEIMRVVSVGIASTNALTVLRSWLGTTLTSHSSPKLVTKVYGNYNIINNDIHFSEAPFGEIPFDNPSNRPDEQDYIGIKTGSSFSGRVFLKSGITDTVNEPYSKNYIFDDISDNFDGNNKTFELKSNRTNASGISTDNAIVLINGVFQTPDSEISSGAYTLGESTGITTISFVGSGSSVTYDVNTASIPRGGIILSIASTEGFGYQPLVAAGGTAIVSSAGTIQSISIGNSGSGYRSGIQKTINVGIATSSTGIPNIEFIGTASVVGGNIVSVAITNPGVGYTSSNPPIVIFDSPLSYSNLPLQYSSESSVGVGTGAVIDIVVGQGSSVISFELKNLGYGYKPNESLTVSVGGTTGIPTNTSSAFSEFKITIDSTYFDEFSSWTVGALQVIDPLDSLFDNVRKVFPIQINGVKTTIKSKKLTRDDLQATLLVFINDILQVPGDGYIFKGGSRITFTEAPKRGDKCRILFYKGTENIDTKILDVLQTVKSGDAVTLISDNINFTENERIVTDIISSDTLETNIYAGPGIANENVLRSLKWCKQTTDLITNGRSVGKDRIIYEPYIQPSTNIIQNVGIGSTIIFVESVKGFFDSEREYLHNGSNEKPQNKIIIISQDSIVGASATAVVSIAGTVSSIIISEGGVGYTTTPTVLISSPIGFGTTAAQNTAKATAVVSGKTITGISVTFGGVGYSTSKAPSVLIEQPSINYQVIDEISYEGDFGVITGVQTTSVGVASTGIVFDFFIPNDSIIRDSKIVKVGIATTGISGIQTGYYFVVSNSNIGNGLTSLNFSGSVVGVGTTFIDNIYQVASVSIAQTAVPGVGITNVAKVTVSVSKYNNLTGLGFSNFYGEYSWGRILAPNSQNLREFNTYANVGGISTSPIVQRYNRLKYVGYST